MIYNRYKSIRITTFIGLLGELITMGYWIIALGNLDSETAIFPSLVSNGIFIVVLVFLVFFVIHIKHYRTLFTQEASLATASTVFKSYMVYGVGVGVLFFPSTVQSSMVLTFVTYLPAFTIGIPYTISGILGFVSLKKQR